MHSAACIMFFEKHCNLLLNPFIHKGLRGFIYGSKLDGPCYSCVFVSGVLLTSEIKMLLS